MFIKCNLHTNKMYINGWYKEIGKISFGNHLFSITSMQDNDVHVIIIITNLKARINHLKCLKVLSEEVVRLIKKIMIIFF